MAVTKNVRKLSSESANELLAIDIAERDAQGRKIVGTYATKAEIPTTLPANGGNADYATTAGNADKCNNHTLGCDVPANADFTNTWPSAYIASISKSGNTLTITPNTGSAITFTYSNATTSSAGLMSSSDKTKLNGIESGAEKNKIKGIQVNGTTIAADANGVVNIQVTIGNGKVTTVKIADSAVTTAKIANDAVDYTKIKAKATGVSIAGTSASAEPHWQATGNANEYKAVISGVTRNGSVRLCEAGSSGFNGAKEVECVMEYGEDGTGVFSATAYINSATAPTAGQYYFLCRKE